MDIICFHNPDEDNGYLSNWYPSSFTVDGVAFSSMEQFMMYRKAICFGDEAVAAQILSTSDVAKIKSLGRQVSNYDESMWNGIRQIVVYEGLLAKFSQNEELKGKLKATENAVLAECAVKDCIWGIGLSMKDPDRLNKAKWNGQNLLGYALMMVRERLQQDYSWEQRKLGDVVQITMGQSPDGSTYSDEPSDYILVQGNADLQNGWVCPRIWTTQITKKADAGDLIMSVRAPAGAMGKTAYNAVIGRGVAAIKGNEFIYQLLVKMDTDGFWKTLSCGSTFESLNSDNIKNAEVKIPTTAEQIKIGGYFQQLDNLITLHQRELYKHLRYRILKVRRKS